MPLEDDYASDKFLAELSREIAEGITETFQQLDILQYFDFAILIVDRKNGLMRHVTDMQKEEFLTCLKALVKRAEN